MQLNVFFKCLVFAVTLISESLLLQFELDCHRQLFIQHASILAPVQISEDSIVQLFVLLLKVVFLIFDPCVFHF